MLKVYTQVYNAMIRNCRGAGNQEATGFITHGVSSKEQMHIEMKNISPHPTKFFAWDAEDTVRAYEMMDRRGHEPLAIYHSHPGGKLEPSETDMHAASVQGLHYIIVGPETKYLWRATAWYCLEPGILVSSPMEVS